MIGDVIFVATWFILLVFAIRLMSTGWGIMDNKEEHEHHNDPELKKAVEESTHPEMQDIPQGEELLSVNFVEEEPPIDKSRFKLDSPALHGDPLHQSLKERIDELRQEQSSSEKPPEEDDEDDDGGAAVVSRR